jgi:endonuclease-8
MPEGDALHRAARFLQALVGERVEVESPHPRAAATGVAERLDGRTLVGVRAHGKNLLLQFDGGYVLRSHLRMSGRWSVVPRGAKRVGRPWLIMRGADREAVLWNGPVLELTARAVARLGPDILAPQPSFDRMLANLRAQDPRRELGDALLDQRVVAGIGNMWKAEALWHARVSPWLRVADVRDEQLRDVLEQAARMMRRGLEGIRQPHAVYRRAGRPCSRCGETIRSHGQGDGNRTAYWCPGCQDTSAGADRPVR